MSRRDSGRKFFFVSRYNINPSLIDISSLRICLRPVDMTLAQNCTGVKPDSSENESNAFRIPNTDVNKFFLSLQFVYYQFHAD